MAKPAPITRDIGEVRPNTYTQQGVVNNAAATAIAGIGKAALDVDAAIQTQRLDEQLEGLRTQWVTQAEDFLTPQDKTELGNFQREITRNKLAVEQGRGLTWDSYRIRGESMLRAAIARRPGLAQEFRSIASNTLGTDVVGATALFLAEKEREAMSAKEEKDTRDRASMQSTLDKIGIGYRFAGLQDGEFWQAVNSPDVLEVVQPFQENEYRKAVIQQQNDLRERGVQFSLPQTRVVAEQSLRTLMTDMLGGILSSREALMNSGQPVTPEVLLQATTAVTASVQKLKQQWYATVADLPLEEANAIFERQMGPFEDMIAKISTGELEGELAQNAFDAAVKGAQLILTDDPTSRQWLALTQAYGPQVMAALANSDSGLRSNLVQSMGAALSPNADPATTTEFANAAIDMWARAWNSNDEASKASAGISLQNTVGAFARVPPEQYKPSNYSSFIQKLAIMAPTVARNTAPEVATDTGNGLVQASARYLQEVERAIVELPRYAALRGNVDVSLAADGTIIRPKSGAALSVADMREIARLNAQNNVGQNMLIAIGAFSGGQGGREDIAERVNTLYRMPRRPAGARAPSPANTDVRRGVESIIADLDVVTGGAEQEEVDNAE